MHFIIAADYTT